MKAKIYLTLKDGVLDPAGQASHKALNNLGYDKVKSVKIGKLIEVDIDSSDKQEAEQITTEICNKLLANTVIEDFEITIN